MLRKKVFRFEYPAAATASASPVVEAKAAVNEPRRRASHRMSLVPAGKTFVPMSPVGGRRQSAVGGASAKAVLEEEMEEGESVVDIVDGEEGDVVYLEVKENQVSVSLRLYTCGRT